MFGARDAEQAACLATDYFRIQSPTVGDDGHFGPSAAPPLGQKTDTSASLDSQLAGESPWTTRMAPVDGSPLAATAAGPGGPGGPAGPAGPAVPAGPTAPTSPLSPFSPCGPTAAGPGGACRTSGSRSAGRTDCSHVPFVALLTLRSYRGWTRGACRTSESRSAGRTDCSRVPFVALLTLWPLWPLSASLTLSPRNPLHTLGALRTGRALRARIRPSARDPCCTLPEKAKCRR